MEKLLKLNLIESLDNPYVNKPKPYDEPGYYSYNSKLYSLKEQADVVMVTLPDGKVKVLTETNFNFGQCDCCSDPDLSLDRMTHIEFYKFIP